MQAKAKSIAFICRIGLAALLVHQGLYALAPDMIPSWAAGVIRPSTFGPFHTLVIWPLAALLLFLGSWLAVGLCSRIVAAWSAIAMIGLGIVCATQTPTTLDCRTLTLITVALALPVLRFGGGHFALVRRGWSLPF